MDFHFWWIYSVGNGLMKISFSKFWETRHLCWRASPQRLWTVAEAEVQENFHTSLSTARVKFTALYASVAGFFKFGWNPQLRNFQEMVSEILVLNQNMFPNSFGVAVYRHIDLFILYDKLKYWILRFTIALKTDWFSNFKQKQPSWVC